MQKVGSIPVGKRRRMTLRFTSGVVALLLSMLLIFLMISLSVTSLQREREGKIVVLEEIAEAIATTVRGDSREVATVLLNDFVAREHHPYLVIHLSDGEVFYYHNTDPTEPQWLFSLGILKLRNLELPVLDDEFPIAVIRTEYVSTRIVRDFTRNALFLLGILFVVLLRRVLLVGHSRKVALRELEDAQARLILNDRTLFFSFLAAKLAHEFNTPLSLIITAQTYLADRSEQELGSTDSREMLSLIGESAEKIKALIQRMQNTIPGEGDESFGAVDMPNMINGLMMGFARDGDTVDCQFFSEEVWMVRQGIIRHVLEELIENAARFGRGSDGTLHLEVIGWKEASQYRLSLLDMGTGIPPDRVQRLFSPYDSKESLHVSTGLGLYLARNYTRQFLLGDLRYQFREDAGACFELVFPVESQSADR